MQKTLLAVTMMSALSLSSVANAFTESVDGLFNGSLEFSGTIEEKPYWKWQIPAASQAAYTAVELRAENGILNGSNTEFTISTESMSIFEGYMNKPLVNPKPGFSPVIKVGDKDASTCGPSCDITIKATNGTTADSIGNIELNINTEFYILARSMNSGNSFGSMVSGYSTDAALQVLMNQQGINDHYPAPWNNGANAWSGGFPVADAQLSTSHATGNPMNLVSQSRLVRLNRSKLIIPTSSPTPEKWAATLPITVTMK